MARQRVVTLLTDFGLGDPYVAEMKGVILTIAPAACLVDISHQVAPGDVLGGAFVLRQALPYFPPRTVHCVVIDPGVGTERRILAARYAGQSVVCPDNGVISLVNRDQPLEKIAIVRNERYFLRPTVSTTFHGRDILAPVAAHLARGLDVGVLGPQPEKIRLLEIPQPRPDADGSLVGEVIHVDRFGNLVSNVRADALGHLAGAGIGVEVLCEDRSVGPIRAAYAHVSPGEALALVNSMGLVEVAVNGGRACDALAAGVGTPVRIRRAQRGVEVGGAAPVMPQPTRDDPWAS
jgi:S-adenosylmethionine hydrolase